MTAKMKLVPFLLVVSLSSFLLFSLYSSSISHSLRIHSSSPPFQFPSNLKSKSNFSFIIKVLTFDRLPSLSRCLHSLSNAYYDGDRVNLHIFLDHFKNDSAGVSPNLDQKLNESRRILDFVDGFFWEFGEKLVHFRTVNVGLQAQWLEAWWPTSDDEFAFVVEDDLEVSPLYYRFLKVLIAQFYYNVSNYHPSIYGVSLQRPRFVPGKQGNKMLIDDGTHLFFYQLVGTWGQLLFPQPWKEFRLWYETHKNKGIKPILEGMVTTRWYKKMGERIWTPWFIKFIHSRGYFNIYTNFLHERALSISHRDAGVNYGKTVGPDSYLVDEKSLDFNLFEVQSLRGLKWYDFCFKEVFPDRVVRSLNALGPVLHSLQKRGNILLVSLYGASDIIVRNLLCNFERLNIGNYIFLGPSSDLLLDLARRGHPIIEADHFFDSCSAYLSLRIQASNVALTKDILVKELIVKKILELEYNVWVLDSNMLPIISDSFLDSFEPAFDFQLAKNFNLLFIRSSTHVKRIWVDEFINQVAELATNLRGKSSVSTELRCFINAVEKVLEQKGAIVKTVDQMGFGFNINTIDVNETALGNGKKFAFWPSGMGLDLVQNGLKKLAKWTIDGDFSCISVSCHSS